MTTQTQEIRRQTRSQMRGFVVIWTFITMLMGLATFMAIYFTYSPTVRAAEVALSNNTGGGTNPLVVIPSSTPQPSTETPLSTDVPVESAVSVAQVATVVDFTTDAPATPIPPTSPPPVPPDEDQTFRVGTQVQVPQDLNADVMNGFLRSVGQDLGLNWIKKQVRWEDLEPVQGQIDFAELDLFMAGMRFFSIKPMFSIVTAPDWARETGISLAEVGPPANNADYVNFVRALLERYPGQVFAVEVWNEQNISREWTSLQGLSAQQYMTLLRDTYNMIQQVSPGTIVISGALAPTGVNDGIGAVDDFVYMDRMIQAGLLDVTDCVGVHHNGYNIGPLVRWDSVPNDPTAGFRGPFDNPHHSWSFRSTLEGYSTRIAAAGYDTKLCVTEFGWAVSEDLGGVPRGFEFAADNTLQEQAEFLTDALTYMDESGEVWLAFIWNFNYGPLAGWDPTNDNVPYSLIGPNSTFRPAYDAVRAWQADYVARVGA